MGAVLDKDLRAGRSVLLFGPRQTGKTTLIKEIYEKFGEKERLEYPMHLPSTRTRIETDPEAVKREVEALGPGPRPLVFIDEIQKTPSVMDVLQYLLDEKKIVLIATGSSPRKMRRAKINWLPGRVKVEFLHPLAWRECGLLHGGGFDEKMFEDRLLFGGLPGILSQAGSDVRAEDLRAYTTLYLDEEIRQEAAVRRLAPFHRFLELAALESGTSPNASRLAAQVGVSHTMIRGYYQILEDSLVAHRLVIYGKSRAAVLRRPKYYFFDTGVRNAAANLGHSKGLLPLQIGTLFEHFVVLEIIAQRRFGLDVSWWRTKKGDEVDLVVEYSGKTYGVEVKATARPSRRDFSGLSAFKSAEKCDGTFLVCQVDKPQKFDEGTALPWRQIHSIWS